MIRAARFSRDRDPSVRSESMLQRTYEYEVFAPADGSAGVPPDAMTILNRYRNIHFG